MSDYTTLLGAEDVLRAGSTIQSAADEMRRTQGYLDETLNRFAMRMEELVTRLEAITPKEPTS